MNYQLDVKEIEDKKYFTLLTSEEFKKRRGDNNFEIEFHRRLQNPENGSVVFEGISRHLLHNGNLHYLHRYFTKDGAHLFGKTVRQLVISNTCLKGYNRGLLDQMPDGTRYIAYLIAKNPKIIGITLTHTQLGDDEAKQLIEALKTNTYLENLDVKSGNHISDKNLNKIAAIVEGNRERKIAEVRKNARLLAQSINTKGVFSTLPMEINAMIAAMTAPPFIDFGEAYKQASKYF